MRWKSFLIVVLAFTGLCPTFAAKAENASTFSGEGLFFKLQTALYAYAPEDTMTVEYHIQNLDYVGIRLHFSDSGRAFFILETPNGSSLKQPEKVNFITGDEFISKGETFTSSMNINLASFSLVRNDTIISLSESVADGETLTLHGELATKRFWIEDQLQQNTMESKDIPERSRLKIQILVRKQTADFDRDGRVDFQDFIVFIQTYGSVIGDQNYDVRADLDGDGRIDFWDFLDLSARWQDLKAKARGNR